MQYSPALISLPDGKQYLISCHVRAKNEAKPMEYDAVKEQIKAKLLNDKQQAAYQSKINQLKIVYPVDKF